MLMGAVCAYLHGQNSLCIYENGIGAINLPLSAAETGLDYSRAVHPYSLHLMANVLTNMLSLPFSLSNPFLFNTKAQMCEDIVGDDELAEVALQTVSCDKKPRIKGKKGRQCGVCTSCLLRRQTFFAAGLLDATPYIIDQNATTRFFEMLPFKATAAHVQVLTDLLKSTTPWNNLVDTYPSLIYVEDALVASGTPNVQERIAGLYRRYTNEWTQFEATIVQS